jgi:hypothetical protein
MHDGAPQAMKMTLFSEEYLKDFRTPEIEDEPDNSRMDSSYLVLHNPN